MEIDETAKDAAIFGIEPPPSKAAINFEVEPDAWSAVNVFLKVQTQWRSDSGTLIGLDYNAVRWVFDLMQIEDPFEILRDLQIMEATVVAGINKRKG
jgi:hypothetical protein